MIAISAVAFGTSLPELMVSLSAIKKGKTDMVAGNILGSNIFNTLVVMGIPALMGGLIVPSSILTLGVPMMLLATFFYFFAVGDKGLSSKEGTFFVILYFFFIGKLFGVI
jgi:cation:H+ antiporter